MRYSALLHIIKASKTYKRDLGIAEKVLIVGIALLILFLLVIFSGLSYQSLFGGFLISFYRIFIAYIISLALALIIALITTANPKVENLLFPFLDAMQGFPSFALFPALLATFKSSETLIILLLTIAIIWPILFSLISGIKNSRQDQEEAATIFGAKGWKRLVYFTLPSLQPYVVTGSIVGWGEGWEFIIAAELLVSAKLGVGSYLGSLGRSHENILFALAIAVFIVLLYIINKLIWLPLLNRVVKYQFES